MERVRDSVGRVFAGAWFIMGGGRRGARQMVRAAKAAGYVWALPAALIVYPLYVLPFAALGYLRWGGIMQNGLGRWIVEPGDNWYARAWNGWGGFSLPWGIIVRWDLQNDRAIIAHESHHTLRQQHVYGVAFYPVYFIIWMALRLFTRMDPYKDHPMEIAARRAAGQK